MTNNILELENSEVLITESFDLNNGLSDQTNHGANDEPKLKNELGSIAPTYQKLHNISLLADAKAHAKLPTGSYNAWLSI
jgi:hypothetical protein